METPVTLHRIDDFRRILAHYQPSDHARQILSNMRLVLLLSVTGGGRNTIINQLLASDRYYFIVSDTTRPPKMRDGRMEIDGGTYHFRSEDDVLSDLERGEFLEAEIIHGQQVSGISIRELDKASSLNRIAVTEVDIMGTENVYAIKPDTVMIFVVPPDYDTWIERLTGREVMPPVELSKRMTTAVRALNIALERDYFRFVINDSLGNATRVADDIASGRPIDDTYQSRARQIITDILDRLKSQGY